MSTSKIILSLLALPLLATAQSCNGNIIQGYCCDGSIAKPNPEGSSTPDNLICCVGDSSNVIQLGSGAPASCTSGTAVPFTQLSSVAEGSGQTLTGGLTGNAGGGTTVEVSGGSTTLLATGGSTIIGGSSTASETGASSGASVSSGSASATAASASGSGSASSTGGAAMITGGVAMQAALGIGALAAIVL